MQGGVRCPGPVFVTPAGRTTNNLRGEEYEDVNHGGEPGQNEREDEQSLDEPQRPSADQVAGMGRLAPGAAVSIEALLLSGRCVAKTESTKRVCDELANTLCIARE